MRLHSLSFCGEQEPDFSGVLVPCCKATSCHEDIRSYPVPKKGHLANANDDPNVNVMCQSYCQVLSLGTTFVYIENTDGMDCISWVV